MLSNQSELGLDSKVEIVISLRGVYCSKKSLKLWDINQLEALPQTRVNQLLEELHQPDVDSLLAAVGEGMASVNQVMRRLFPEPKPQPKVAVQNHLSARAELM